jgi:hypothetical protein
VEQPADAQLSEDGRWWWDGAQWQPVEPGPQAGYDTGSFAPGRLSDDGQWRWDGTQWQPAGEAPVPLPDDLRDEMANFGEYYPEVMALAHASDMEDWLRDVVGISPEDVPTDDDEPLA